MSVAVSSSGTETTVLNTPATLAAPAAANVYQFMVDSSAMAAGDVTLLTIKAKVLTAGAKGILHVETLTGAQSAPIFLSPPVTAPFGADFIIEQTAGTVRAYPWSVMTLA